MDVTALATLSRLLDEALELSPERRTAWVENLGPEYDDLKPRLRRLLDDALLLGSTGLATLPRLTLPEDPEGAASSYQPGATVGPYRLIRLLGEGGMGHVWLAERTDGLVKRPVALKLPRGLWMRAGLAERMARERDILSALTHPNIARLYDAGLAADGQPFLAIEYVDGQPLDQYCEARALAVQDRLRLFLQVIAAVSYAHAQLVVHRDLKPSNILVNPQGEVRLLDFGIAKLLQSGAEGDSLATQLAGRALTPQYASPEQVRGAAMGTPSDVYSLGVLLYELLAGTRPYVLERQSPAALEEAILAADIVRPSLHIADAARRAAVAGDLDWIVLKAMAKDPAQRYASAAALGDDIERHLRSEPVLASPPTARYRLGKFVRRHRLAVAATMAVSVALVAAVVGTTFGLVLARRAESEARTAADRARTEAQTADRVSQFLVNMFDLAKPEEAGGRAVTARDMLDRGVSKIDGGLGQEPLVQARLRRSVGDAYSQLGLYPEARPQLEKAVAAARSAGPAGDGELVNALTLLGQLQRRLDDAAGAERTLREALALAERRPQPTDSLGLVMNELALLQRTRAPEEALSLYRRTHARIVAQHGADHADAGTLLVNIGSLLARMRRYQEAVDIYGQALPILTRHYGEHDGRVGLLFGNLALAERQLGHLERAAELQQRDLDIATRTYAPDHPSLATVRINLARIYEDLGRYPAALDQIDQALAILGRHFRPEHALALTAGNTRSQLLTRLGRPDESRAQLESLVRLQPGSAEAEVAHANGLIQLSHHERLAGRFADALASSRAVMDNATAMSDLSVAADAAWAQACAFAAQGKQEEAGHWRQQALDVHARDKQSTEATRLHLHARHYACAGDVSRSLAMLGDAIAAGYRNPAIHVDPSFAAVRRDPAFARVVQSVPPPIVSR